MIEIKNVNKTKSEKVILKDITLLLKKVELVVFIGP